MNGNRFSRRSNLMGHKGDEKTEGVWRWVKIKVMGVAKGDVGVHSGLVGCFCQSIKAVRQVNRSLRS